MITMINAPLHSSFAEVGLISPESNGSRIVKSGSGNLYIADSYFCIHELTDNGGAILYKTTDDIAQLLIEFCTFYDVHTEASFGGAIYMAGTKANVNHGSCVVNRCCASKCFPTNPDTSTGMFIRSTLSEDNKHINKVLDSSIIHSTSKSKESYATLRLEFAQITVKSVNLSHNSPQNYPSAFCKPFSDGSEITCFVDFCSFRNNTGYYGIDLFNASINKLSSSNFIENNIYCFGLIYSGESIVEGCSIINNKADCIFYVYGDYSMIARNCTIESNDAVMCKGNVNSNELTPKTQKFINAVLPLEITEICKGNYDYVVIGSSNELRRSLCVSDVSMKKMIRFLLFSLILEIS